MFAFLIVSSPDPRPAATRTCPLGRRFLLPLPGRGGMTAGKKKAARAGGGRTSLLWGGRHHGRGGVIYHAAAGAIRRHQSFDGHRARATCHARLAAIVMPIRRGESRSRTGPWPDLTSRRPVAGEKALIAHHSRNDMTRSSSSARRLSARCVRRRSSSWILTNDLLVTTGIRRSLFITARAAGG